MAHFSLWQRSPLRNSFMPSRRQSRQTGPMYLAKFLLLTFLPSGAVYSHWPAFFPLVFSHRWTRMHTDKTEDFSSVCIRVHPWLFFLNSPLLRRAAAVMRDRGHVFDRAHFQSCRGQSSYRRFAA